MMNNTKLFTWYDWILIDGAPALSELAIAAVKAADLVLIPVQPSPYDIWATSELVDVLKARREITNGRPRVAFVISRAITRTVLSRDVRDALAKYQLPALKAMTCQRVIYASSAIAGSSVLDEEPKGPAAAEIRALIDEIREFAHA